MQYLKSYEIFNDIEDYYEVEKIITRRFYGKNKIYLIKWLGYPIEDCTWEPASHLEKINDLIENFDANFPRSIDKRLLRKYLRTENRGKKQRVKNKNHIKAKNTVNIKKSKNNQILINLDDFSIVDKEIHEDKKDSDYYEMIESVEISGEKNEDNKIDEAGQFELTNENTESKLIKPIIIW